MMKNKVRSLLSVKFNRAILVLGVLIAALPIFTQSKFLMSTGVSCFLFAAFGVAWNIIGGYGAQISWCHSAFAAIGAYSSFLSFYYLGLSPFVTMPLGMIISYLCATLIGRGTFKLRGIFFSLSTIAFAEIVKICLLYFKDFTGGSSGRWITYRGNDFWNLSFSTDIPFYYIAFGLLILILLATVAFQKTKAGYFLGAIKGNEDAATTLGIETFEIKLLAFQVSAVMTSIIGCIYAYFLTYIDPYNIASLDLSVKIGMSAIVGGLGTLWGPVLGGLLLTLLTQITNHLFADISGASMLMYAIVLILVVIFRPQGLITLFTEPRRSTPGILSRVTRMFGSGKDGS